MVHSKTHNTAKKAKAAAERSGENDPQTSHPEKKPAGEWKEKAMRGASDVAEKGRHQAQTWRRRVGDLIQGHLAAALLLAAGTGLLVGFANTRR